VSFILFFILQAIIHLESIGPSPKRIEFLDSLVEKFITRSSENPTGVASSSEREELSCIFLEVIFSFANPINFTELWVLHFGRSSFHRALNFTA
jgi:hypothetical protein